MKKLFLFFILFMLLIPVACNELDNPIESQLFSATPIIGETKEVKGITQNTAISGGNIISAKEKTITSRGVCWDTLNTPTLLKNFTNDGNTRGEFISYLTNLKANKTYYVRAYVKFGEEVVYGTEVEFKTLDATSPVVTTTAISEIKTSSAKSGGTISSTGGSDITSKGVVWSTNTLPVTSLSTKTNEGAGTASFTSSLTNLQPNTKCYFRAYAINFLGKIGYGQEGNFTTQTPVNNSPAVPSNPTPSDNSMGLAISLTLSWSCSDPDGDALTYDVYFGIDSNPTSTISTNKSAQNISHSGLTNFTTYYWKVVAKDNKGGSTSSPVWIFHTVASGSTGIVTDIDGNIYNTITIGTQVWMVENLKTTKYRNGDLISNVEGETAWSNLTTGAYCNYGNDVNNATTYGRLYNWYAVNDSRKIAPTGWHVATDAEWTTLTNFVGGESVAGAKLKSKTGWNGNGNGTDDFGFTALPGGYRSLGGSFLSLVSIGDWWSSNESSTNGALEMTMYYDDNRVISASANKKSGFSVRCVKD